MQFTKEQIEKQAAFVKVLKAQREASYDAYIQAEEHNYKCIAAENREEEFLKQMRERTNSM